MFAHQDVVLLGSRWTWVLLRTLETLDPEGWCGLVGRDDRGSWQGLIRDRDGVYGEPFHGAREVQTLDEIVLIRRRFDRRNYFDEALPGWHAYGVEACCRSILEGHRNHVVAAPVWHDSPSANRQGLKESHAFVERRFAGQFSRIYTTCGELPDRFRRRGSYRSHVLGHTWKARVHEWMNAAPTRPFHEVRRPMDAIDAWTETESRVECLRGEAWYGMIEAVGFADATPAPRTVNHRFGNWDLAASDADVVVVGPEVCRNGEVPTVECRRLITAEMLPRRRRFRRFGGPPGRRCVRRELCRDQDDSYWLLSEYNPS